MKRHKQSGDQEAEKSRKEECKKNKEALLKFFESIVQIAIYRYEWDTEASTNATSSQKAVLSSSSVLDEFEDWRNPPNEPAGVGEQSESLIEDGSLEGMNFLDCEGESINNYKDFGTRLISVPDYLCTLVVTQGSKAV